MNNNTAFVNEINDNMDFLEMCALKYARNTTDAADLLQDAIERMLKSEDKFKIGSNFKAWSGLVMRNLHINNWRRNKNRHLVNTDFSESPHAFRLTCDNDSVTKLNAEYLQDEINNLKDMYRIPFLMYYQGYRYEEISQELNLPLGTLKTRIFYARKQLRKQLSTCQALNN